MTRIFSSLLLLCLTSCGNNSEGAGGQLQIKLPKALQEVSGLALLPDGRLLAVADERARVYSVDFKALRADKFTTLGDPAVKGDFEGIALLNNAIYLVTASGILWRQELGAEAEDYEKIRTGLGKLCEVEGLTAWRERNALLILCKQARKTKSGKKLRVFAWSEKRRALEPDMSITRTYQELGVKRLHPSGISFSADRQSLFIIAAQEQYFLEITLQGQIVRAARLPNKSTHRQTEGVVITAGNTLYLADEGRKGRGTVTRYVPSF
jgi:uncharacterized protein YjiK